MGWSVLSLTAAPARADAQDSIYAELTRLLDAQIEARADGPNAWLTQRPLPEWAPPLPTHMQCNDTSGAYSECSVTPDAPLPARVARHR